MRAARRFAMLQVFVRAGRAILSRLAPSRKANAARIAAARQSLSGSVAAAIVQALMNEQAVALRGLTDRWHAATQKQRDEKPKRPPQNLRWNGDDTNSL
jgi:hypothetical protein